ncbi:MAG: c-type cytochrome [Planctomycetes bacterium]|nr:c-type cytochrome [Planctomycetota bacterium]
MGKFIYLATLAAIALGVSVAGWQVFTSGPSDSRVNGQAEEVESFVSAGCWQCHQVGACQQQIDAVLGNQPGVKLAFGPDLSGIGGVYPDAWHIAHLYDPATVVGGSQMPRQSHLFEPGTRTLTSGGQAVIVFLQSLREANRFRQPLAQSQHSTSLVPDLARGKLLFGAQCAGCHGPQGRGDGPAAVFFAAVKPANLAVGDIKRKAGAMPTVSDVFSTLTTGITQTGMPSFQRLSEQERADLAGFVVGLKQ